MPNRRLIDPDTELETAHPFRPGRFDDAEPQEARGAPGSRDLGAPATPREHHTTDEFTGVNPPRLLSDSMPFVKPGDQGG